MRHLEFEFWQKLAQLIVKVLTRHLEYSLQRIQRSWLKTPYTCHLSEVIVYCAGYFIDDPDVPKVLHELVAADPLVPTKLSTMLPPKDSDNQESPEH